MTPNVPSPSYNLDALVPAEVARKAEDVGVRKAQMGTVNTLALAVLAGAFIALGALFATTVTTATGAALPWGVARALGGLVFSLGLILVVLAGAELFTGNNLIVMAWAAGKVSTGRVLRNWALVYAGNFAGALGTAVLVWLSGQYAFAGGAIGLNALSTAAHKVSLGWVEAVALGVLANALVCLAVWLTFAAHTVTDKILAIVFPIAAFVAAGFEHSIANMYFIPVALLIQTDAAWLHAAGSGAADPAALTWGAFLWRNLLPVTLGNVIGGAGLVGLVYWFIYLRGENG
jgi:formate/nitrite transporter